MRRCHQHIQFATRIELGGGGVASRYAKTRRSGLGRWGAKWFALRTPPGQHTQAVFHPPGGGRSDDRQRQSRDKNEDENRRRNRSEELLKRFPHGLSCGPRRA